MIGLRRCSHLRWLQSRGMSSIAGKRVGSGRLHLRHLASASTSVQLSPDRSKPKTDSSAALRVVQGRIRGTQWQSSSVRGGPASHARFRMGVRRSQVDSEEVALLEKHRQTLDDSELTSVYDVVESIEWRHAVTRSVLDRMLHFLQSPQSNIEMLSDRQIGVLFSGTGKICVALTPSQRQTYTKKITAILNSKGVKLGILARNALLEAQLDNSVEVDVVRVLKELKLANIEPNGDTFAVLSRAYALKGDVVGVIEIVNHMNETGIDTNERIIEWMIFALARSGRDEHALSVIESFSKNGAFSEAKLRIAYANAKATIGETESMIKIFNGVSERLAIRSKENANLMLDVLFTLLEQNNTTGVEKLLSFLPLDENGKLSDTIGFTTVMGRMRQYRDLKDGNIQAAVRLYKLLSEKYARSQRDFFRSYLFDKLKQSGSVPEAVELGVAFEEAGILKFLWHIRWVLQLSTSPTEKRGEILAHIANALFKWESPEMRYLKEWLLEPLVKNLDALPEVMARISKKERIRSSVACSLVDHLMFRGKFDEVTKILNGPLKGIPLNVTNLAGTLKRVLTRSNAKEDELKLASHILASAFPDGDERYTPPLPAVEVIKAVLMSKAVSEDKARMLIKMWLDEDRIAISAEDIDALQKALTDADESVKAKLVTVLKRKPKTLLRWKETEDINVLEDEAKSIASSRNPKKHLILQSLYSVIAAKRCAEKTLNVDSMSWLLERYHALPDTATHAFFEFDNKLRRTMREAIITRNVNAADRLWKIGSGKLPTLMKIGYAAVLHYAERAEDAKRILSEIHSNGETFDVNTIANSPLVIGDRKESEAFLELVIEVFKMSTALRKRLLHGIRVKEFDKLVSAGRLEEAFSFAKDMSAETGRAFGQLDLMEAALTNGDMQLLHNVISMVQNKHDRNSALLDFGVALLENERTEHAARVFATSGLHISSGKLEYFLEREVNAKRADVLLNLFTNLNEGGRAATVDLKNLLIKLVNLYGVERDSKGITRLQNELKRTSFPVNEELRRSIESNLKRVSSVIVSNLKLSRKKISGLRTENKYAEVLMKGIGGGKGVRSYRYKCRRT
ncbi:Leucine-rich PPR motif-containing protein, mitochondrial [Toxocara canis]|uniref:Leucine-rich PPR motif-containing protein, mitochondrial n=1 Tax=Toxocara canis TaxID=6265 RepID=A0A0B2VWE2_TOXCA|nr:Leucine-rich PPR motif-containing protein, mitochondrial [Toxocara canis]